MYFHLKMNLYLAIFDLLMLEMSLANLHSHTLQTTLFFFIFFIYLAQEILIVIVT